MAESFNPQAPLDLTLPEDLPATLVTTAPVVAARVGTPGAPAFDSDSTTHFQAKMSKAPVWFCSFVASTHREKRRFRDELVTMRGAWPLLMKQRNGGKWTHEEKDKLKVMVRSASSVSPYLFIWAIPGSMILLPFLAWFLDRQRKKSLRRAGNTPS